MIKALRFLLLVLPFCFSSSLLAEPAPVISLASVGDRVRVQNPSLAAARLQLDEAMGRLHQAGRLANPELETTIEHNRRFREGRIELGLSQKLPLTKRLQFERAISLADVERAQAEILEFERQLIRDAKLATVRLLAVREKRRLLDSQIKAASEFSANLSQTAERGEASSLDAGLAKIEAAALQLSAHQLEAERTAAAGELKPLLGMRPEMPLILSGSLADAQLPARSQAERTKRRPDLVAAQFELKSASLAVPLEQARSRDDIEVGVFAAAERSEDAPEGYENEAVVGLQFKIALPWWNRNEGNIAAARATEQRKQLELAALQRRIAVETATSSEEMRHWADLLDSLAQELIPMASTNLSDTQTAYLAGQVSLQAVFLARDKQAQLDMMRIDALREFHLARIRHEAALGTF